MKPRGEAADEVDERRRAGDVAADDAERLAERALDQRRRGASARAPRRRRRRAGRRGRPRAPRRGRSSRRAPRRRRGSRRSARCRRPSSRRSRRRRSSGGPGRCSASWRSRSFGSLCRQMRFSQRAWRMPSIIEAWLERVREDDRAGQPGAERAERRPVRDVAGGEEQRGLLAVQVGEFALEQHVLVGGAGDVAGAAGAGAAAVDRIVHRRDAPSGAGPCRGSRSSTRR